MRETIIFLFSCIFMLIQSCKDSTGTEVLTITVYDENQKNYLKLSLEGEKGLGIVGLKENFFKVFKNQKCIAEINLIKSKERLILKGFSEKDVEILNQTNEMLSVEIEKSKDKKAK